MGALFGGELQYREPDGHEGTLKVCQDLMVPDAQDMPTARLQERVSIEIASAPVLPAINLDCQTERAPTLNPPP